MVRLKHLTKMKKHFQRSAKIKIYLPMTKEQWKEGAASIFNNSNFKREASRGIYENDDLLVSHAIMTFPNGTKDAVMWVATKKDGLIYRVETGSTPLSV